MAEFTNWTSFEYGGKTIYLRRKRMILLLHKLQSRPRQIFTRGQLLDALGFDLEADERAVDHQVQYLRKELRKGWPDVSFITTHSGLGYSWEVKAAPVQTTGPGLAWQRKVVA